MRQMLREVKASVTRNQPIVLTVNQQADVGPTPWQVRGARVGTGLGFCLRDVSRMLHWPRTNLLIGLHH